MFYFGPEAAQDDPRVLDYFYETEQVKRRVSSQNPPPTCIFVARPGAGKTALVRWLADRRPCITTCLGPEHARVTVSDKTPNVADYRVMFSVELSTDIILHALGAGKVGGRLYDSCKKLEKERKGLLRKYSSSVSAVSGSVAGFGLGFALDKGARKTYLQQLRAKKKVEDVEGLLRQVAGQTRLALVVDDPEHIVGAGLTEISDANAKRVGAFLSVLNRIHQLGVDVMVFLKEHVIQSVAAQYNDYSHFKNSVEGLLWTEDDVLSMLNARIEIRLQESWNDVFSISRNEFKEAVLPYLINGPRDLIFVCNNAARNSEGRITDSLLHRSVSTLARSKWNEIRVQYGSHWPGIDGFAQEVIRTLQSEFGDTLFSPRQFRETFERQFTDPHADLGKLRNIGKESEWINNALSIEPCVEERLFLIGCLGYTYEGNRYYPWCGRALSRFGRATEYFISPLFSRQFA